MSAQTSIEWTGRTWNPLVAYLTREVEVARRNGEKVKIPAGTRGWFCTKCSPGCAHCYAEKINLRLGNGLEYSTRNLDDIEFRLVNLDAPLKWRKPCTVFVNSMTDLFHEAVPRHLIDQVFAVMALAKQHTFQVLTKRAKGMREYLKGCDDGSHIRTARLRIVNQMGEIHRKMPRASLGFDPPCFPLPNVWLGVSVENQKYADERIPELIATPAVVRFLSCEPLLGPIDLTKLAPYTLDADTTNPGFTHAFSGKCYHPLTCRLGPTKSPDGIGWVIIGGESGGKSRPCDLAWLRALIQQCKDSGVPVFINQVGARPVGSWPMAGNDGAAGVVDLREAGRLAPDPRLPFFKDLKGGAMTEWPEDLRVREMPEVAHGTN